MKAVIQAGGKGTRLMPYTMVLPKPLMPVGSQPVLELLLRWLRRNGSHNVYVTTGYLGHLIRSVCGDGRQWDLQIKYTTEPEPLGTIGGLSLLGDEIDGTFLMVNGDVLTDLNLNAFAAFHRERKNVVSVAVARRNIQIDFGVIETIKSQLVGFREKPTLSHIVSMGIYCMEPDVLDLIPRGVPFGFDDLMYCMLGKKLPIGTYLHDGLWLDIGRVEDFQSAQRLVREDQAAAFEMALA